MSLFTDSNHVTQSDLAAVDPEVPEIVTAESFTGDQVGLILDQAWDICANEIVEATRPYYDSINDPVLAFHTYGAFSQLQLSRIVVSSEYATRLSPVQNWMVCVALENFYMTLANRRSNDRYNDKLTRAQGYTKSAWRTVVASGLPTVLTPLPCPGAVHELGAGAFTAANLVPVAGGSDPETSYEVAIAWTSASYVSPSIPGNGQSGPSVSLPITLPASNRLRVTIAGMNAPGSVAIPRPSSQIYVSQTATGWNVYVGAPGGVKYLQNPSPLPLSQATYDLGAAPVLSGNQLWSGQVADGKKQIHRIAGRG